MDSMLHFPKDCAWARCTEAQDDTRSVQQGEKSTLEEYMAISLLCFWHRDPHLYRSNTRLSWLSHLETAVLHSPQDYFL